MLEMTDMMVVEEGETALEEAWIPPYSVPDHHHQSLSITPTQISSLSHYESRMMFDYHGLGSPRQFMAISNVCTLCLIDAVWARFGAEKRGLVTMYVHRNRTTVRVWVRFGAK